MVASVVSPDGFAHTTWTLNAEGQEAIAVPDANLLFNGDYGRAGTDLIISDDHGQSLRINDYFNSEPVPLVAPNGSQLSGNVVYQLAGPLYPGQYAQATNDSDGPSAIGQVETLEGGATVQRADGTVEQLAVGTKVFQNDVVTTADGGKVAITFADGTVFTLASGSRMTLDEFIYDPNSNDNSAVFNLVEGSFVFIAGNVAGTGGMDINTADKPPNAANPMMPTLNKPA